MTRRLELLDRMTRAEDTARALRNRAGKGSDMEALAGAVTQLAQATREALDAITTSDWRE